MPTADHLAQAVTLLSTGGIAHATGRALWRHGKLVAFAGAVSAFFAALVPVFIAVLIFWFQVLGIDLVD